MVIQNAMFKLILIGGLLFSICLILYSYLFLEKYLTEKEIIITVLNKERFGNEEGMYLIFTNEEVFQNSNNLYHQKSDSDQIYQKLERGVKYRIKVVGIYIPGLPRFRNIVKVIGTEV